MLKKMGMIGVGVTAGLLAVAPAAMASEGGHGHGHEGHDGGGFNSTCNFDAGDANTVSEISGDSMANIITQTPLAGNNVGNIADCSSFLNDNLNGNFTGNNVALLGDNLLP